MVTTKDSGRRTFLKTSGARGGELADEGRARDSLGPGIDYLIDAFAGHSDTCLNLFFKRGLLLEVEGGFVHNIINRCLLLGA
jgi:hypothetical protein